MVILHVRDISRHWHVTRSSLRGFLVVFWLPPEGVRQLTSGALMRFAINLVRSDGQELENFLQFPRASSRAGTTVFRDRAVDLGIGFCNPELLRARAGC